MGRNNLNCLQYACRGEGNINIPILPDNSDAKTGWNVYCTLLKDPPYTPQKTPAPEWAELATAVYKLKTTKNKLKKSDGTFWSIDQQHHMADELVKELCGGKNLIYSSSEDSKGKPIYTSYRIFVCGSTKDPHYFREDKGSYSGVPGQHSLRSATTELLYKNRFKQNSTDGKSYEGPIIGWYTDSGGL